MKTIVITYKGVVIKDANLGTGKRAVSGDVVTVNDHDAALLIGMGRAKAFEPPKDPTKDQPKELVKASPRQEPEREPERDLKPPASPRPERKKE